MFEARKTGPILFFVATLLVLVLYGMQAPLHMDTARDLLIARDCVLGAKCVGAGPKTSFGDLLQGALWSHALEMRERFAIGFAAFERIIDVTIALSAGIFALTVRVGFGRRPTAIMWASWLLMTATTTEYPILWNPTLSPLPIALFHLALAIGARTGKTLPFVLAAVALALSIDLHVAYAIMLPLFVVTLVALARRPLLAFLYSAALAVELVALDSPAAFRHDMDRAAPHASSIVALLVLAVVAGALLRGPAKRRSAREKPWIVAAASGLYFVVALVALSRTSGRAIEWRYLAPAVPPLAIFASVVVERVVPSVLFVATELGVALFFFVSRPPTLEQTTLRETEPIAREVYARASFDDLYVHLRGPRAFPLLATLASLEPVRSQSPRLDQDLLVLRLRRDHLPTLAGDARVIDLGRGYVAVVVAYAPRIDPHKMEVCRDERCQKVVVDASDLVGKRSGGWTARAYPSLGAMEALGHDAGRLTFRLRVLPGAPSRVVVSEPFCREGSWRIDRAPGISGSPARAVDLLAQGGEITFSTEGCPIDGWLPPFAEVRAGLSDTMFP